MDLLNIILEIIDGLVNATSESKQDFVKETTQNDRTGNS